MSTVTSEYSKYTLHEHKFREQTLVWV